jgi:hypothetical protein
LEGILSIIGWIYFEGMLEWTPLLVVLQLAKMLELILLVSWFT